MIHQFSNALGRIAHACSGFGRYFANVQSGNCHDCPDCRCEDGPTVGEARRDYLEMLRSQRSTIIS